MSKRLTIRSFVPKHGRKYRTLTQLPIKVFFHQVGAVRVAFESNVVSMMRNFNDVDISSDENQNWLVENELELTGKDILLPKGLVLWIPNNALYRDQLSVSIFMKDNKGHPLGKSYGYISAYNEREFQLEEL